MSSFQIEAITSNVNPDNSYVSIAEGESPIYGFKINEIIKPGNDKSVLQILAQLATISREYIKPAEQNNNKVEQRDNGVIVLPSMRRKLVLVPEVAQMLGIINPYNPKAPVYLSFKGTGYDSNEPTERSLSAESIRVDGFTGYESEENDIVEALSQPMLMSNPFNKGKHETFHYITGRLNIVCFPIDKVRVAQIDENGNKFYKYVDITPEEKDSMPLATGKNRLYVQVDEETSIYTMRDYLDAMALGDNQLRGTTANEILTSIAHDLSYHPDFKRDLVSKLETVEGKTDIVTGILLQQIERRYCEAFYEANKGIKLAQRHPQNDSVWGPKDFEESTIKDITKLSPAEIDLDFNLAISDKTSGIRNLCQDVFRYCLTPAQIEVVIGDVQFKLKEAINGLNVQDHLTRVALEKFLTTVVNGLRGTIETTDKDLANIHQSFGNNIGTSGISNINPDPLYDKILNDKIIQYLLSSPKDNISNNINKDPIKWLDMKYDKIDSKISNNMNDQYIDLIKKYINNKV